MKRLLLPHKVSIVKPTKTTDAATGVGSLDYATPISTREIDCKVDLQTASAIAVEQGRAVDKFGVLFTKDRIVNTDDVFTFNSVKYVIESIAEKFSHDGSYHHTECSFMRDIR